MIKYYSNLDLDSYLKFILGKALFVDFVFLVKKWNSIRGTERLQDLVPGTYLAYLCC